MDIAGGLASLTAGVPWVLSGYIRRPLPDIMDDLAFTQNIHTDANTIESVLKRVQALDPPGVAARSLEECLIIQLKRKEINPNIEKAISIILQNGGK